MTASGISMPLRGCFEVLLGSAHNSQDMSAHLSACKRLTVPAGGWTNAVYNRVWGLCYMAADSHWQFSGSHRSAYLM